MAKNWQLFPFQDCQLYPAITFNFPAGTPPAHECFRTKQNHSMKKLPGRHSLHKNFSFPVRFCQLFNFHGLLQSNRSCKLPINADPFGSDNCQVISLVSKRNPRTIPVSDISKLSLICFTGNLSSRSRFTRIISTLPYIDRKPVAVISSKPTKALENHSASQIYKHRTLLTPPFHTHGWYQIKPSEFMLRTPFITIRREPNIIH